MKYDFDNVPDRRNTGSLKWDVLENELSMWVADMDFPTAPEIREAFIKRVEHGVFGYSIIPDEWNEAYASWWKRRHNLEIEKDWLIFCIGVIPAISSMVRKLTTPNENVVILTPVYNIFFNSIVNNGCRVLECPLLYENGEYEVDFTLLETHLSNPQTSLLIWCNPHNPVSKIWDKETMARVGEMCKKYGVTVISDEIHCDIVRPGLGYIPFASVNETCKEISVTCIAPTKCFNIAGLQTAAVFAANPFLRHKVWRALNTDEVAEPNAFAILAATTAFEKGEAWLNEMCEYVFKNRDFVEEYIKTNIPKLHVVKGDATYLLWVDISEVFKDGIEASAYIRSKTGLFITEGNEYGKSGEKFVRINVACPLSVVKDGMERLKNAVETALN
ncbi:MAG: pyridoxal phosphate-dependent aminotransferase [Lachnospiraceae bacterium]|nr:pyridoxal phosphate-dependent aminotransferase [Lachnospiraceae bacterium]